MKKILALANPLALVLTVSVNYFCNAGLLNGNTMKTISDRYYNHFTPAGYAFSIWGLIYLGLFGFVVYTGIQIKKDSTKAAIVSSIGWWFVVSCLANALWVIAWLSDYTGLSVVIMMCLLYSLVKIIVNTRMELDAHPLKEYLFIYWPFALYSGWVSVALIANVSAYFTKVNWTGLGISNANWAILMIFTAGLLNIIMIYTRNLREYGAVGIWALFAISVSNKNAADGTYIVYACYIVIALIGIFILRSGLKNRNHSVDNM